MTTPTATDFDPARDAIDALYEDIAKEKADEAKGGANSCVRMARTPSPPGFCKRCKGYRQNSASRDRDHLKLSTVLGLVYGMGRRVGRERSDDVEYLLAVGKANRDYLNHD